jgi:hypothetical protein
VWTKERHEEGIESKQNPPQYGSHRKGGLVVVEVSILAQKRRSVDHGGQEAFGVMWGVV